MNNKRNKSYRNQFSAPNSNWLKFSNTSVTSARVRQQRSGSLLNNTSTSSNMEHNIIKRRKFFNASTELLHVVNLIVMSLCRQITNRSLLKKRSLIYLLLVFIGGLLKDFAPFLLRALIISISSDHFLNKYLVKLAWFWNTALLLPLITLSSSTICLVDKVAFSQIEQSIDDYHQKRSMAGSITTNKTINPNLWNTHPNSKTTIRLPTLSQNQNQLLIEKYQQSLLNELDYCRQCKKFSLKWFRFLIWKIIRVIFIKDVLRLIICTIIYYASIMIFGLMQSITTNKIQSTTNTELSISNGRSVSINSNTSGGFDISGHVFILIFSNLIFMEECAIMTGWEPLGDRLYSLSLEYMNIEINERSLEQNQDNSNYYLYSQNNQMNRMLFLCWAQYNSYAAKIRILFLLMTTLAIIWDFMLIQTIFFYHSLIEKLLALAWAYSSWYFTYRILFPLLYINVRKVNH